MTLWSKGMASRFVDFDLLERFVWSTGEYEARKRRKRRKRRRFWRHGSDPSFDSLSFELSLDPW